MIEYKVVMSTTGGTADAEDKCNREAKAGWRLVSTAAASQGISMTLMMFFAREAGDERPEQNTWGAQHRGEDDV